MCCKRELLKNQCHCHNSARDCESLLVEIKIRMGDPTTLIDLHIHQFSV